MIMNRHVLSVGAAAAALFAVATNAGATVVSFSSFGGAYPLYGALPPNETLYTDFSTGNPGTGTGSLYGPWASGSQTQCFPSGNCVAAPATSTSTQTAQQFFAVLPGQSETFTFPHAVWDVSIYLGSLDSQNQVTIDYVGGGSATFTGAQLAAISGQQNIGNCTGNCTIFGALTNGRWTFSDNSADITGFSIAEGTGVLSNSFEVAQIATSVPEVTTWAMLGLGFATLALAGARARPKIALEL
jgi:hypothetical protein